MSPVRYLQDFVSGGLLFLESYPASQSLHFFLLCLCLQKRPFVFLCQDSKSRGSESVRLGKERSLIYKNNGPCRAYGNTRWFAAAQFTFERDIPFTVKKHGPKRAGLNTSAARDTQPFVNLDDLCLILCTADCSDWTRTNTGGVSALLAR